MTDNMVSTHFSKDELGDERSGEISLAPGFIDKLEQLRIQYGHAMVVTDGCRSSSTNRWLLDRGYPASVNSFHLIQNTKYKTGGTCAVDIGRPNGGYLARLLELALRFDWSVGIGRTFLHLDRRVDYTDLKPVVYTYN
jgi:hypothetical protein